MYGILYHVNSDNCVRKSNRLKPGYGTMSYVTRMSQNPCGNVPKTAGKYTILRKAGAVFQLRFSLYLQEKTGFFGSVRNRTKREV